MPKRQTENQKLREENAALKAQVANLTRQLDVVGQVLAAQREEAANKHAIAEVKLILQAQPKA